MALGPRAALAYRNAVRQQMIAGGMGLAEALRKCNFSTIPSDALERRTQRGVEHAGRYPTYGGSRRKPSWPVKWGAGGTILAQIFAAIEAFPAKARREQALFAALMQLPILGLIPK